MLCYGCMTEYNGGVCPHCGYSEGTEDDSFLYLKPGTELAGRYIVGRALSLCEMGTDYIALDKAGNKRVLIKELLPLSFCTRAPGEKDITVFSGDKAVEFDKRLDWFIGRCRVLSELADIPELHTCTDLITENKTAYAVFELPCGETLGAYLKEHGAMPAEAAVKMLLPAMRALSVCHRHGLLHLSVSPEQFTVSPGGNITLTGFLFDHDLIFEDEPPLSYVFLSCYFAPEVESRRKPTQSADVYSLGAVLFRMMTGEEPSRYSERKIRTGRLGRSDADMKKYARSIPRKFRKIIMKALCPDIQNRTQDVDTLISELEQACKA